MKNSDVEEKLEDGVTSVEKDKTASVVSKNKNDKKSNKFIYILLVLIIVVALAIVLFLFRDKLSIGKSGEEGKVENEVKEYYSEYRISGNSLENFDLYFLQLENSTQNKVYSPLSIKYALEMLSEGSSGNTKAQIDSVIGDYEEKKYINSQHMAFANAMFIKQTFRDSIKTDYTTKLTDKYNAEIIYDSFSSPDNLNSWVSNKTFNLVNNLLDDVSKEDFILVNALAIDMEWNKKIQATLAEHKDWFSVSYSHENFAMGISPLEGDNYRVIKFNNDAIDVKTVEIGAAVNKYDIVEELGEENIRQTVGAEYSKWVVKNECNREEPDVNTYMDSYIKEIDANYNKIDYSTDFQFYVDDDVKVFAKDLKEYDGTTLQYVGIMPKNVNLDSYIKNINSEKINTIIGNLKEMKLESFKDGVVTKIVGSIPLFKFEYELKLMDDLKKLGIIDVFDINKANLSGIVDSSSVAITKASHKANIEFSNEGIKAAAATAAGGRGATGCGFTYKYDVPVEIIDLTFNNPYLFLIRDKNSGEVWFTGTVYEPVKNIQ